MNISAPFTGIPDLTGRPDKEARVYRFFEENNIHIYGVKQIMQPLHFYATSSSFPLLYSNLFLA